MKKAASITCQFLDVREALRRTDEERMIAEAVRRILRLGSSLET